MHTLRFTKGMAAVPCRPRRSPHRASERRLGLRSCALPLAPRVFSACSFARFSFRRRCKSAQFSNRYGESKIAEANTNHETYRGHYVDLSAVADRKDSSEMADGFRHQIDIVENSGIPIVIDDFACVGNMLEPALGEQKPMMAAACYGRQVPDSVHERLGASVWESEKGCLVNFDPLTRAIIERTGTVMVRPSTLVDRNSERPVLLHELLHAYHDHVLPGGFSNQEALSWFEEATEKSLYPADQYLMTNEKEFFGVTTSAFLFGRDGSVDRAQIKQAQPDYYKFLAWLFAFDPDRASSVPVASAN
jgi:hypothetical protein